VSLKIERGGKNDFIKKNTQKKNSPKNIETIVNTGISEELKKGLKLDEINLHEENVVKYLEKEKDFKQNIKEDNFAKDYFKYSFIKNDVDIKIEQVIKLNRELEEINKELEKNNKEITESINVVDLYKKKWELNRKKLQINENLINNGMFKEENKLIKLHEMSKKIEKKLNELKKRENEENVKEIEKKINEINNEYKEVTNEAVTLINDILPSLQELVEKFCTERGISIEGKSKISQVIKIDSIYDFINKIKSGINGYFDGTKIHILNTCKQIIHVILHEYIHYITSHNVYDENGKIKEIRRGISINGNNYYVNEALTELFNKRMMGEIYPQNPDTAYISIRNLFEDIEACFIEKAYENAFFNNDPESLIKEFEKLMGKGTWSEFSKNVDATFRQYSKEEREQKRNGIFTMTDQIRDNARNNLSDYKVIINKKKKLQEPVSFNFRPITEEGIKKVRKREQIELNENHRLNIKRQIEQEKNEIGNRNELVEKFKKLAEEQINQAKNLKDILTQELEPEEVFKIVEERFSLHTKIKELEEEVKNMMK